MKIRAMAVAMASWMPLVALAQQEAPKAAAVDAPASSSTEISRWIDDRVIGIVVVDLSRADLGVYVEQLANAAAHTEPSADRPKADLEKMREVMSVARTVADDWVREFRNAGGREAWIVISPKPAVVVPLTPGADSDAIAALVRKLELLEGAKASKRDGFLIAGNPLRGLPLAEPARAEHVKAALGSIEGVAPVVKVVMTPSDPHKLMLGSFFAQLGRKTGTDVPKDLNLKIVWAALGASNGPHADIQLVIQATNNTSAQQVAAALNSLLSLVSKEEASLGSIVEVLREMKFVANEDRAELRLNASTTKRIVKGLVTPLVTANQVGRQRRAMSQARQMLVAVHSYAADKQEALPESMDAIAEDYLGGMDLTHPSGKKWKYSKNVKRLTEIADPSEYVLVYEEYKNWPAQGVIVGFADGHVELIKDEARFKDLTKGR